MNQTPPANPFWVDAGVSDDDVTLPSLPAVDVPVIEDPRVAARAAAAAHPLDTAPVQPPQHQPTSAPGAPVVASISPAVQPTSNIDPVGAALPAADAAASSPGTEAKNWFGRMKEGLTKSSKNLADGMVNILIGGKEIDDELLEEVETQLLVADIGVDATKTIISNLTERAARRELIYSNALYKALQEELVQILSPRVQPLAIDSSKRPFVILVVGVNGVGKTTTIGKLAKRLQSEGKKVLLAAGDTFRAAATEQLQIWGERNHIDVVAQGHGADSASVIFDAFERARARGLDVVIADTAGRLSNKSNLMEELKKVKRVMQKIDPSAPHEIMLVVDAGNGQNAINQVQDFDAAVGLTGLTITKLDGTAKGGVLFNIASRSSVPIRFIGVGEKIDDLQPFSAKSFVAALFDRDR